MGWDHRRRQEKRDTGSRGDPGPKSQQGPGRQLVSGRDQGFGEGPVLRGAVPQTPICRGPASRPSSVNGVSAGGMGGDRVKLERTGGRAGQSRAGEVPRHDGGCVTWPQAKGHGSLQRWAGQEGRTRGPAERARPCHTLVSDIWPPRPGGRRSPRAQPPGVWPGTRLPQGTWTVGGGKPSRSCPDPRPESQ